jgi:hypothetical protein
VPLCHHQNDEEVEKHEQLGTKPQKREKKKMASRAHEQALAAMLSHLALSFDGAILGAALAYAAVRSFLNFTANSKSLAKIRKAPTLSVSDLRSLLQNHDQDHQDQEQKLVIARGQVEAKSAVDGSGKKSSRDSNVLLSHESGDKAVILQRTQTVRVLLFIYCFLVIFCNPEFVVCCGFDFFL